jgi:hypothetical protein
MYKMRKQTTTSRKSLQLMPAERKPTLHMMPSIRKSALQMLQKILSHPAAKSGNVDAQGRISHLYLLIPSKINFPRTRSLDLLRAEHQGSPILDAKRRAHTRKYDVHKECQFYGSF